MDVGGKARCQRRMQKTVLVAAVVFFLAVVLAGAGFEYVALAGGESESQAASLHSTRQLHRPVVCFAPGTPWERVNEHARERAQWPDPLLDAFQFGDNDRWSSTAMSGSNLGQGEPTIITWSIVPDGTEIAGFVGEPTSDSDLIAFLDGIYGGAGEPVPANKPWFTLFEQVFARWGELTGNIYVYEPNDDGSSWRSLGPFNVDIKDGEVGVRGDVRIAGHTIDGNSGILAYNFFPDLGDMVLDTADSFYGLTGSNSLRLRNVMAHEHGHGLGISHVCPVNFTKLMEPFATTAFDGPQHDDILAGQRGYGDRYEQNDTIGEATDLGALTGGVGVTEVDVSVDGSGDVDYYRVEVENNTLLTVTITPIGSTYLSGQQNSNGSCSAGTSFDSLTQSDLSVEIIGTDQSTVLASATGNPAGVAESIVDLDLIDGAGTYYIHVFGDSDAVQLYDMSITADTACEAPQISQEPVGQTVCAGDAVVLSVTATGTAPLDYQWRRNGIDVLTGTSDVLTIDPASGADSGDYDVVISNACDTITSSAATVTVEEVAAVVVDGEPVIAIGTCNTVSWAVVAGATEYQAQMATDPCFTIVTGDSGWIATMGHEFCGLQSGVTYYFRVRGRNVNLCESTWSDAVWSMQCYIPADQDDDCDVDVDDLIVIASIWLEDCTAIDCGKADLFDDDFIDSLDYELFWHAWLSGP